MSYSFPELASDQANKEIAVVRETLALRGRQSRETVAVRGVGPADVLEPLGSARPLGSGQEKHRLGTPRDV